MYEYVSNLKLYYVSKFFRWCTKLYITITTFAYNLTKKSLVIVQKRQFLLYTFLRKKKMELRYVNFVNT